MDKGFDFIAFPVADKLPEAWQSELVNMQAPLRHIAYAGLEAALAATTENPLKGWGEKARSLPLFKRDETGSVVRELLDVIKENNAEPGELLAIGLATVRIAQEASRLGVARQSGGGDSQSGGLSRRHGLPPKAAEPYLRSLTQICLTYHTLPTEQRLRTVFGDDAHQQETEVEVCTLRQGRQRRLGVFATGLLADAAVGTKSQPLRDAVKIMAAVSGLPAESKK